MIVGKIGRRTWRLRNRVPTLAARRLTAGPVAYALVAALTAGAAWADASVGQGNSPANPPELRIPTGTPLPLLSGERWGNLFDCATHTQWQLSADWRAVRSSFGTTVIGQDASAILVVTNSRGRANQRAKEIVQAIAIPQIDYETPTEPEKRPRRWRESMLVRGASHGGGRPITVNIVEVPDDVIWVEIAVGEKRSELIRILEEARLASAKVHPNPCRVCPKTCGPK